MGSHVNGRIGDRNTSWGVGLSDKQNQVYLVHNGVKRIVWDTSILDELKKTKDHNPSPVRLVFTLDTNKGTLCISSKGKHAIFDGLAGKSLLIGVGGHTNVSIKMLSPTT